MQLHELKPPDGSRTRRQRIGRGTGSGRGKTSGRGQKGQNARSEGFRLGFEGGQMPFAQRIPKLPGFKNPFKRTYEVVNLSKLHRFTDGSRVDPDVLVEAGLARPGKEIKVLGTGDLKRKLTVEAHAFSAGARAAIEARGGAVKVLGEPRKVGPKRSQKKVAAPSPEGAAEGGGDTQRVATTPIGGAAERGGVVPERVGGGAAQNSTEESTSSEKA